MLDCFTDNLYDPSSLKIYGNVLVASHINKDTGELDSSVLQVQFDSKNPAGRYDGVDKADVLYTVVKNRCVFIDEDNENFVDISLFFEITEEELNDSDEQFTTRELNGEVIARFLNAVYVG